MKRRSLAIVLFILITGLVANIEKAHAETTWQLVGIAAGILKNLWDLKSSILPKSSDYGIYSPSFYPERYVDLFEDFDHGSVISTRRTNWRDPFDGTSRYFQEIFGDIQPYSNTIPFEHGWGNCTWICSHSNDPASYKISGQRVTIVTSQYRIIVSAR